MVYMRIDFAFCYCDGGHYLRAFICLGVYLRYKISIMEENIFYFPPKNEHIATQPVIHSVYASSQYVSSEPNTVHYVDQRSELESLKAQNERMMADQERLARQVEALRLQKQKIDEELSERHEEIKKLKTNAKASDQNFQKKLEDEKN